MKAMKILALVMMAFFLVAAPAMAQPTEEPSGPVAPVGTYILTGAGVGVGIAIAAVILGAGYGFGRIGSAALESMARQPEVAGQIQTAMLIIAALLEGATFFALIVCILLNGHEGL